MVNEQATNPRFPRILMIPGLGADRRMFQLVQQAGIPVEALEFIRPIEKETLQTYAHRMAEQVESTEELILGGVSLGGIIAGEMAKILKTKQLLLISTVKSSREFPFYLKAGRILPVHRLVSGSGIKKYGPRERRSGMTTTAREILDGMRRDADPYFVQWAVNAVVNWKRKDLPEGYSHLHGSRDPLFPPMFVRGHELVKGGGHNIIITHPEEVAQWIRGKVLGT